MVAEHALQAAGGPANPVPASSHVLKESIRKHLAQSHSAGDLKRWFDPLRLDLCGEEKCLCVLFPHPFFGEWFARSIQDRFEEQLRLLLGPGFAVRYMTPEAKAAAGNGNGRGESKAIDFPFGHQFTFDSFIANRKNDFPLATAREVAKSADVVFNPFLLSGPSGSGKTHLLKSLANEISKRTGPEKVFFGTLEDLYKVYHVTCRNDLFAARTTLQKYSHLLVDDFQLLKKYRSFQSELITLFNSFYDARRQMIFCCTERLAAMDFLDPKLRSRLEWGLLVTLKEPDLDIRLRYVERQCKAKRIALSREQIMTLAQRFTDLRFLQGILLKFYAYKEFVHKDCNGQEFDQILAQTAGAEKRNVSPEAILETVAAHFAVELKDILGAKRHQGIVRARQMAMYLCRELVGSSYPALGRLFGGRDHSTALYAVQKVGVLVREDQEVKKLAAALKKKCLAREDA
jgi:chromosomal replication initiator protein